MSRIKSLTALLLLIGCGCGSRHLYSKAESERNAGDLALAIEDAQHGFDRWRSKPETAWHWRFKLLLAELLSARDISKTAELLTEDLPPHVDDHDRLAIRLLTGRGALRYRKAEYAGAAALLDRAHEGAARSAPELAADIQIYRAAVCARAGDYNPAETYTRDAIALAQKSGNRYAEANALGQMGYLLLARSRFDEAISILSRSFAISRTAGYEAVSGLTASNLGWCYFRLGDLDRAAAYYKESGESTARTGNLRTRQVAVNNLGTIHYRRGEYREAVAEYQRALTISEKLEDTVWIAKGLNDLASASVETGELDRAEQYASRALQLKAKSPDVNERVSPLLNSGAIAHARKNYGAERDAYQTILAAAPRDPHIQWQAHAGLGYVHAAEGNLALARAEFGQAVALIDSSWSRLLNDSSKLTFPAGVSRFYHQYMDFLIARGLDREALEFAESRRALLLSEKIGAASAPSNFPELARRLDAVLLSYWLSPTQSYLWITTPEKTRAVKLPTEPKIRSLVEHLSKTIQANRSGLTSDPAGRELFDMLVAPAAGFLRPNGRVILVPDGVLHGLNFETLATPSGHYWLEEATIEIAPSLRLTGLSQPAAATGGESILLIGDPLYGAELPKLPYAAEEIRGIAQLFPKPVVFTGAAAQPTAYQTAAPARFPIIHFAAHALGNPESPLDSAVALSSGPDSYKLYAREIQRVPLNAELVTVSACRSAGERAYSGEGLVGFAWAFLSAGARNVIASLWDVNDRSTAAFMQSLYAKVKGGDRPADALRAVKLEFLHSGTFRQKPYYWAPFQVYAR